MSVKCFVFFSSTEILFKVDGNQFKTSVLVKKLQQKFLVEMIFSSYTLFDSYMIHEMQAVEEVDFKGLPNQLGSRHHKKVGSSN